MSRALALRQMCAAEHAIIDVILLTAYGVEKRTCSWLEMELRPSQ